MINAETKNILDELCQLVPTPHYKDIADQKNQDEVVKRLKSGILPKCIITDDINEIPIEFRNIITGAWLFLCEQDIDNYKNLTHTSKTANLLSLKAIELSYLQSEVQRSDN